MSRKRRAESQSDDDSLESSSEDSLSSDSEANSEQDNSTDEEPLVSCDFEFFDPQKQDFLGIKHLLRQLFDTDADLFDLEALTEIILAQPLVGSTVKTEGHEGDPLSFLTVLNLRVHQVGTLAIELTGRILLLLKRWSSIFWKSQNHIRNLRSNCQS
jgi:protein BCP1